MKRGMGTLLLTATIAFGTSCGSVSQARKPISSTSTHASSQAGQRQVLIAVAEYPASKVPIVRLFREDGTQANHFTLRVGDQVVGAAGSRIFVNSGNHLKALHSDGKVEDLQTLPSDMTLLLPGPDGSRWLWTTQHSIYDGYSSTIYVGRRGAAPRAIQTLSDPATWLLPVSWTPQGIFTERMGGIDGYFPFSLPVISAVDRIDPDRGTVAQVTGSRDCAFADEASDGTVACFGSGEHPVLRLIFKAGRQISIPLATPRFNYTGDAYFSADGTMLTVAGATGVGPSMGNPNPEPEQFGTDLVKVSDGSIVRIGPAGVRLAMAWRSWLPDGKLVLWRPTSAAGGPPGLFLLPPNGQGLTLTIPTGGAPVGYLTAS